MASFNIWIGGSCDYGHKERAGAAAAIIEQEGAEVARRETADLHTTEFRMMLTLMVDLMASLPEQSDLLFLTNAAYIQNFDRTPTAKTANADLIRQCIDGKRRHSSVRIKIVAYHKSPLLMETHTMASGAMERKRRLVMTSERADAPGHGRSACSTKHNNL